MAGMDERKKINLREAFPETPEMCREAVLQAVSSYREEEKMKRSYRVLLIAAVVLALMCGAAFAIGHYFSVREYVAAGNPSAAFEDAIVPVEQSADCGGLRMTLGDAVCDGRDLIFTLNIAAEKDAEPVYVYPELRGSCNGAPLDVRCSGFDFSGGFSAVIPGLNADEQSASVSTGVRVALDAPLLAGKIDWTYALHLYKPTGKLVADGHRWSWTDDVPDDGREYYRGLYENGEIPLLGGNWVSGDYLYSFADDWQEYMALSELELIERTGQFEFIDTVEFHFSTEIAVEERAVPEDVYVFDEFTVRVKSLTASFMQLSYELEVVYNEPQPGEHEIDQFYLLFDDAGAPIPQNGRIFSLADDMRTCSVRGSAERISDAPLAAVTFRLDHELTADPNDTAADMPAFTVPLKGE